MNSHESKPRMTADELNQALKALGWKQVDLARRTGLGDEAVSRWSRGAVPVPAWVGAFLGMAQALHQVHQAYVAPIKPSKASDAAEEHIKHKNIKTQNKKNI